MSTAEKKAPSKVKVTMSAEAFKLIRDLHEDIYQVVYKLAQQIAKDRDPNWVRAERVDIETSDVTAAGKKLATIIGSINPDLLAEFHESSNAGAQIEPKLESK